MRKPLVNTLRRAGGRIKRHLAPKVLILLYHRVAETDLDPWALSVTPDHFAEHLQVLRTYGRVIPLRKLSAALATGDLPRRAVAVTFDDGYADNLLNAKPLLEKYEVPATVFISTGNIGEDREFWWDELERLFLRPGSLPRTLKLAVNGNQTQWELAETAEYSSDFHHRNLQWRAWEQNDPSIRHTLYRSLWHLMRTMSESERNHVRRDLRVWAGLTESARPTHRALSCKEISALACGGLIDVGCHTITHPRLSDLTSRAQRDEISGSKACLEETIGRPVNGFAYPYGGELDYTRETSTLVQDAGFEYACTTTVGAVARKSERFQLPRVLVENMNGQSFKLMLSGWLRN